MMYRISHPTKILKGEITLTASKSESNRVLIIQALCANKFEIKNLATAEDTRVLKEILEKIKSNTSSQEQTYDVGAAGTTMRFLTAYLSTQLGTHILTGSERMKNRPIGILVNALRDLGAEIEYIEKEGYPPLKIKGKALNGGEIEIDGSVSSQYISALLLISPTLKNGLKLKFKFLVTSLPYIIMTLKTMELMGVKSEPIINNTITIKPNQKYSAPNKYIYEVEGDWSGASYWYAFAALAKDVDFVIKGLKSDSIQGDGIVAKIFESFGISTNYIPEGIRLRKAQNIIKSFDPDFSGCPDLAQTVAVVCSALQIFRATLTGLHTLKIKETDRIAALKNELKKVGTDIDIIGEGAGIVFLDSNVVNAPLPIATYEDHRMAMAFSAFAMVLDSITIEHPEVVKKSYPDFWNDLQTAGFVIEKV